jgi:hypothetical protein
MVERIGDMRVHRWGMCRVGAAMALLLLLSAAGRVHAQTPTAGLPSPCTAPLPALQAPPSGAVQIDGGFAIPPTLMSSLDDAQAQFDLPPPNVGYQLASDSLSLDDLQAIANSVQSYATP